MVTLVSRFIELSKLWLQYRFIPCLLQLPLSLFVVIHKMYRFKKLPKRNILHTIIHETLSLSIINGTQSAKNRQYSRAFTESKFQRAVVKLETYVQDTRSDTLWIFSFKIDIFSRTWCGEKISKSRMLSPEYDLMSFSSFQPFKPTRQYQFSISAYVECHVAIL